MKKHLCIFGEVLFDVFPDGQQVLGGAPFNVAWHLQAFNQNPVFISRIGDDEEGRAIKQSMIDWGMDVSALQIDETLPTGKVSIQFQGNEPEYDIVSPSAYDAIQIDGSRLNNNSLLYHGSLAIRDPRSSRTLEQLIRSGAGSVFIDVNLRFPWYEKNKVLELIKTAHWAKLNAGEFDLLYPGQGSLRARLAGFLKEFELKAVILTNGEEGATLYKDDGELYMIEPRKNVTVVDTVGAGDAFASVIIMGIINEWPKQVMLERAQEFASNIVGRRGATVSDANFYNKILSDWGIINR